MMSGIRRRAAMVFAAMLAVVAVVPDGSPAIAAGVTAGTDLRIIGGDAMASIACGNGQAADDLAQQRHIVLQRSKCTAKATGGSVTMENVDIYVSTASLALNAGNAVLAALAADAAAPGVAEDHCENHRPPSAPGTQLNKCWAISHGGRLTLNNVTSVNHAGAGRTTTRVIDTMAVPTAVSTNGHGSADALCTNIKNDPVDQQDDCTGTGAGAAWSMKKVDVVIHNADGSTTSRQGINVEVRGGNAVAYIYCFNVMDASGRIIQINVCSATADGGDATLRNVTIHTGT